MKMKRYGDKYQSDCTTFTRKKRGGNYLSRGLHKAFNKDRIPLPVKSSKSPQINKMCICKIILFLHEHYQKVFVTKHLTQRQTYDHNS